MGHEHALAVLALVAAVAGVTASATIHGIAADVGTLLVTQVRIGRLATAASSVDAGVGPPAHLIAAAAVQHINLEVGA